MRRPSCSLVREYWSPASSVATALTASSSETLAIEARPGKAAATWPRASARASIVIQTIRVWSSSCQIVLVTIVLKSLVNPPVTRHLSVVVVPVLVQAVVGFGVSFIVSLSVFVTFFYCFGAFHAFHAFIWLHTLLVLSLFPHNPHTACRPRREICLIITTLGRPLARLPFSSGNSQCAWIVRLPVVIPFNARKSSSRGVIVTICLTVSNHKMIVIVITAVKACQDKVPALGYAQKFDPVTVQLVKVSRNEMDHLSSFLISSLSIFFTAF